MSIIHNALKKAQANLEKKDTKKNAKPSQSSSSESKKSSQPTQQPQAEQKPNTPPPVNIYEKMHQKPSMASSPKPSDFRQPEAPAAKPKTPARKEKAERPVKSGPGILLIVFLIIFLLGIVGGGIYVYFAYFAGQGASSEGRSYRPKPFTQQNYSTDKLVLNGTMMMGNKRVALINNEVYEQGEEVYGRKILKIMNNKVELIVNGKVEVLRLKR